jgi:hypothetical protein
LRDEEKEGDLTSQREGSGAREVEKEAALVQTEKSGSD